MDAEFGGSYQQDAQEFIIFLMTNLHEETNLHRDRPLTNFEVRGGGGGDAAAAAARVRGFHTRTTRSIGPKYFNGVKPLEGTCSPSQHSYVKVEPFDLLARPVPAG
ncbi:hypothetical protein [Candidatus Phytoplasma fabacearum]|uniref:hypothetical protein n=1 Tax=Candidatus Phytoplasma fabacearum TaxID=2982628 RepID=UPI0030EA3EB6